MGLKQPDTNVFKFIVQQKLIVNICTPPFVSTLNFFMAFAQQSAHNNVAEDTNPPRIKLFEPGVQFKNK